MREAKAYRHKVERVAENQTDEQALETVDLFRRWDAGIVVSAGDRVQHGGSLYRCIQGHTAQAGWEPDQAPALWAKVGGVEIDDDGGVTVDEFPAWVQPTGGHDAYNRGDKVTFEGRHYASIIDGNGWSPADYPQGWELI